MTDDTAIGLRIDIGQHQVTIESPAEGLCVRCQDELPTELLQLLFGRHFELEASATDVKLTVFEALADITVDEAAETIERRLEACQAKHRTKGPNA